ncbi:hypothetical protein BJ878DRAFT_547979 [Calycina marina]|uniref:RING-type domain-containing protein n=1 Tax=Calycina marina TaxID=1763456 RepID=A0A9P8CJ58_9HELO|nr:hypothetical protein BJ878DRAFT_547979 [Calycina marina]
MDSNSMNYAMDGMNEGGHQGPASVCPYLSQSQIQHQYTYPNQYSGHHYDPVNNNFLPPPLMPIPQTQMQYGEANSWENYNGAGRTDGSAAGANAMPNAGWRESRSASTSLGALEYGLHTPSNAGYSYSTETRYRNQPEADYWIPANPSTARHEPPSNSYNQAMTGRLAPGIPPSLRANRRMPVPVQSHIVDREEEQADAERPAAASRRRRRGTSEANTGPPDDLDSAGDDGVDEADEYEILRGIYINDSRQLQAFMLAQGGAKKVVSQSYIDNLERIQAEDLTDEYKCCTICYNNLGVPNPEGLVEQAVRLPKCKHIFGEKCLIKWFKDSFKDRDTCPYCRDKLPSQSSFTASTELIQQLARTGRLSDIRMGMGSRAPSNPGSSTSNASQSATRRAHRLSRYALGASDWQPSPDTSARPRTYYSTPFHPDFSNTSTSGNSTNSPRPSRTPLFAPRRSSDQVADASGNNLFLQLPPINSATETISPAIAVFSGQVPAPGRYGQRSGPLYGIAAQDEAHQNMMAQTLARGREMGREAGPGLQSRAGQDNRRPQYPDESFDLSSAHNMEDHVQARIRSEQASRPAARPRSNTNPWERY